MASTGTIKLYLQAENKQGLCPLQIWYRYNRLPTSFSTGYTVRRNDVDFDKLLIKKTATNYKEINQKIDSIVARIKSIMASATVEPTIEYVKAEYSKLIAKEEEDKKKKELAGKGLKALDFLSMLDKEELEQKKQEWEKERAQIEAHPFYKHIETGIKQREQNQINQVRSLFDQFLQFKNSPNEKKRITANTIKTYKSSLNNLCEFAQSKLFKVKNLSFNFEHFNDTFYQTFHLWGGEEKGWSDSHFGNQIKNIKTFLLWVADREGLKVHFHFRKWDVPREHRNYPSYLSLADLDLLWEYSKTTDLDYEKYRLHLLIFQNLTALRISEVLSANFRIRTDRSNGNRYLYTNTVKNKSETYIVIYDERIIEILEIYNYDLRLVSAQKFNEGIKITLKKIFVLYNIHQEEIEIFHYKNGEKVLLKTTTLADSYSSHDARRNALTRFATEFHWDTKKIAKMIGSKDVKTLEKHYIKTGEEFSMKYLSDLVLPNAK